jgi:hypothetical protein
VDNLQFVDQAIGQQAGTSNMAGIATAWTQLQVLNQQTVSIATTGSGASASTTINGQGIGQGITTYWTSSGEQAQTDSLPQGGYTTTGLDLCAPPVLTQELWEGGCSTSTSLQGSNPPAIFTGSPPTISGAGLVVNSVNQAIVPTGTALTCSPGGWSGAPTSYTYQWQYWNAAYATWTNAAGASTSATYTPSASTYPAGTYIACQVTAANANGSAQALSASVELT